MESYSFARNRWSIWPDGKKHVKLDAEAVQSFADDMPHAAEVSPCEEIMAEGGYESANNTTTNADGHPARGWPV